VLLQVAENRLDDALAACDQQLKEVGDNKNAKAVIYYLKGGLLLGKDRTKDAEGFFKKSLRENPDYPQPYYMLSEIYLKNENTVDAIAQYEALLAQNPKQARPHMMLGIIYERRKEFDISEKHYRAALDINPEFVPAANNLAYILAVRDGNLNEALGLAQKAKEKVPNDPSIMDTLGLVYYKKGLYDNAIGEFNDSIAKLPDNATIRYHLGLAYYKKGENEKARAALEKALSLDGPFDGAAEARRILEEL